MLRFKRIFGIQEGHTLREVQAHLGNYNDDWTHEEFNAQGKLVARYESWDHLSPGQPHITDWRKISPDGTLVEEHHDLPL